MKNFNVKQFIFIIFIFIFLFCDLFYFKKKFKILLTYFNNIIFKMSRKKGLEPLTLGFGNQCSTN